MVKLTNNFSKALWSFLVLSTLFTQTSYAQSLLKKQYASECIVIMPTMTETSTGEQKALAVRYSYQSHPTDPNSLIMFTGLFGDENCVDQGKWHGGAFTVEKIIGKPKKVGNSIRVKTQVVQYVKIAKDGTVGELQDFPNGPKQLHIFKNLTNESVEYRSVALPRVKGVAPAPFRTLKAAPSSN